MRGRERVHKFIAFNDFVEQNEIHGFLLYLDTLFGKVLVSFSDEKKSSKFLLITTFDNAEILEMTMKWIEQNYWLLGNKNQCAMTKSISFKIIRNYLMKQGDEV